MPTARTVAQRPRSAGALVSILLALLFLTACGSGTTSVSATDQVPTTPATETSTAPPNTEAAAAPASPDGTRTEQAGELEVSFLDVGQGDATLVRTNDATMLIDTGRHDREDVVEHLHYRGVETIDVVVITHGHADHIGQLDRILTEFDVGEVWMSGTPHTSATFERAIDAIAAAGVAYEEPLAGASTTVGSIDVDVVHPAGLTGDLHADTLAVRIGFGEVSFLFTGDAEGDVEAELVARGPAAVAATVHHVGHHGSTTSTTAAFLAAVAPEVAVYSAGRGNSYGHPHDEVVDRITGAGIDLYGTDVDGTVTITTDGVSYSISTDGPAGPTVEERGADAARAPPSSTPTAEGSPAPVAAVDVCAPGQVDLNSAAAADLERIIHVGTERAGQILALRPFSSLADLTRVSGLGEARVADITQQGVACVP